MCTETPTGNIKAGYDVCCREMSLTTGSIGTPGRYQKQELPGSNAVVVRCEDGSNTARRLMGGPA